MSILNAFKTWLNQDASIYSNTGSVSQINGAVTKAYALKKTIKVAFYEGNSALQFISEKFKAEVDGVIIIDPRSLGTTVVDDTDEIRIGSRIFKTVHNNDIMLRNELLVIGIKENN